MPPLAELLEVQDLDLAADALDVKRRDLVERSQRLENQRLASALDQALTELQTKRKSLSDTEHEIERDVADMAERAKRAEDTLYSGAGKSPKELEGFQEELRLLKEKQSELEEGELELMESIEATDAEIAENRSARAASDAREGELDGAIAAAEAEIDAELAGLRSSRDTIATALPGPVLLKYDQLRANARVARRPAAKLVDGACLGCRMTMAVLDRKNISDAPPDAVVQCTHCQRLLVRE